jgi:hypothetical protein
MTRFKIENSDGSWYSEVAIAKGAIRKMALRMARNAHDDLIVYSPNLMKGVFPLGNPSIPEDDWVRYGVATPEGQWQRL